MRTIYSSIFHNLLIKLTALALAVLTWYYVADQLYRAAPQPETLGVQTVVQLADKNVVAKRLPVHVNLIGSPNPRYKVAVDKIRVTPSECVIVGTPEATKTISFVLTEAISVKGRTKTLKKYVKLQNVKEAKISTDQEVYVVIPIEKKRIRN